MDKYVEDRLVEQFAKAFIDQDQNSVAAWLLKPMIKKWAQSRLCDWATKPATIHNVYELVSTIIFREHRFPLAGLVVEAWGDRTHQTTDPNRQVASFMAIACLDITNNPKFSEEVSAAIEKSNPQTAWDVICVRAHALGECMPVKA